MRSSPLQPCAVASACFRIALATCPYAATHIFCHSKLATLLQSLRDYKYVNILLAGPEGRAGVAGPPVFLSNAHFCDVDPAVADTVLGLNCSLAEHVTLLDVEPTTGITMRAAKRLMMSTEYGPGQQSSPSA